MKPIRGLSVFALWLLRISLLVFSFYNFGNQIKVFSVDNLYSIISLLFIVASIFLFLGGFSKKSTITVLSGLTLSALTLYFLFDLYEGFSLNVLHTYNTWAFILATSILFTSIGNKV